MDPAARATDHSPDVAAAPTGRVAADISRARGSSRAHPATALPHGQHPLVSGASECMAHLYVAAVGCMYIAREASALSFSHTLAFDFAAHQFRFLPTSKWPSARARGGREVAVGLHSGEVEMGEGAFEVVKVVDLEDGEGEEDAAAAAEGSSRETRMLPRMPVRVLLAEGDDSTRHVISALLRKCGYQGTHRPPARAK